MTIIVIIPARGGSKGLPNKNIKLLSGIPLIAYSIREALKLKTIDRVIVSTEDKKIAKISKKFGAEVIERPINLAKDDSPTIDVILNVMTQLGDKYNESTIIVLLQPTSPLRTNIDIENSINLYLKSSCESVISVCEVSHPPYWSLKVENNLLKPVLGEKYLKMRRQDFEKTYIPNGAIFIADVKTLRRYNKFYTEITVPYIMPIEKSVDIDYEFDFLLAEILVKKFGNDKDIKESYKENS